MREKFRLLSASVWSDHLDRIGLANWLVGGNDLSLA
jgi:hypothetical protein